MYLGITLNRLKDFDSAVQAFKKALELDGNDCTIYLNYAIVMFNNGKKKEALDQFMASEEIFMKLDEDEQEPEMLDSREVLAKLLGLDLRKLRA